jgi:hypothetical protein
MKAENIIIPLPERAAGASTLGSHRFLDEFALAYHRAVAEHLRERPQMLINHARQKWMEDEAFADGERQSFLEWQDILDSSKVEQLIVIITEDSERGQCLRSSSPFVGTISPEKRLEIFNPCEQRTVA